MVVIEWLSRLPRADGIVILGRDSTDCAIEVDAKSRALLLWPTMGQCGSQPPDGFRIVDQDGVSARLTFFRETE